VSGWRNCALGDVIELKRGYDLPKRLRTKGPYPVVSSSGISGSHNEAKVQGPGVVTGRYGTLGEVFFIEGDFWPLNTALYVRDFKGNDPKFISYFLRTIDFYAFSDKAAVPGVNRNHVHQAPVRVPGVGEQKQIAHILGTLDDKIELNRRMNRTLEAMARAIFKSWFVDFEPVHAKAEGREPVGMDPETAALFPNSFEGSPLGRIPKGWEVHELGEFVEVVRGRSYRSAELDDSDVALVTLKSIRRGGGYRHDGLKAYTGTYKPEQVVVPGEIVVSFTDVTQAADVIGRPAVVEASPDHSTLVASLDLGIARPAKRGFPCSFLYRLLSTESFHEHAYAHTTGTTVLHLSKTALPSFSFLWPGDELLCAFGQTVSPLEELQMRNTSEASRMAATRDALLPPLLSGELRLTERAAGGDPSG